MEILELNLRKAIELEAETRDLDPENYYWPVAIRGSGLNNIYLKEVLLQELRDNLEEWIEENSSGENRREWITRYLDDILLFRRIGLHLLRLYPDKFSDLVRDELLEETNYDQYKTRTEFLILLQEGFDELDEDNQQELLSIIENGPDKDKIRETAESQSERFTERSVDQVVEEEIDRWKLHRFWMIGDDLPEPYDEQLDELVEKLGEPDHPESMISTRSGSVSHEGPMDIEELRNMSPREALELCVSWEPEGEEEQDFFTEKSPRGLAEHLQQLISESPSDFVPHFDILTEADVVYIYHAFQGLDQAIEEESFFEWSPVLDLCHEAANRHEDDLGLEARKRTCRLISSGLSESSSGLIEEHSAEVKEILLTLADDPNPESDDQDDGLVVHDDPIHASINTVRPIAIRTLISYAVAKAKDEHFEGFEDEGVSGIEKDVKSKLSERLTDQSTAVHSVFGQRLLNLSWIDRSFVEEELESIFPREADKESRERFKAAWTAFIRANRWNSDAYDWLKNYYIYSLGLFGEDSFTFDNIDKRFVAHVLLSHIHTEEQLGDKDSLLTYFYERATPDLAGDAAWTLWRWGKDEPEFRERWDMVKEIWEWRLNTMDDDYEAHTREFQWFIEWLDLVGEETDISKIESILIETIPYIGGHRRSWETLEQYLADAVAESTLPPIRVYEKLIEHPEWPDYLDFGDGSWEILETALSDDGKSAEIARDLTEEVAVSEPEFLRLLDEYRLRE